MAGGQGRNGLLDIFLEIHRRDKDGRINLEATFNIDPTVERLAAALYMDGSASMQQSGNYGRRGLFGLGHSVNPVQEAMRVIVPYIAGKDANGRVRVAYWATEDGRGVQVIGEMTGAEATEAEFRGPDRFGSATHLLPAVRDFVGYINGLIRGGEAVGNALAVFVTDGQFHDQDSLMRYTVEMASAITAGKFPKATFTLVGVGPDVDRDQMLRLMHEATPESYAGREIWCYALADSVDQLPELVTHLVDANVPAFWGGATIKDDAGNIVQSYEDMVPALLEFSLPAGAQSFTISTKDRSLTQPLAPIPYEEE